MMIPFVLSLMLLASLPAAAGNLHLWAGDTYLSCVTCPASNPRSACSAVGAGASHATTNIFNPQGPYGNPYARASPWNALSMDKALPELRGDDGAFLGVFTLNTLHPNAFFRAAALAQVYRAADGDLSIVRGWMCNEGGAQG